MTIKKKGCPHTHTHTHTHTSVRTRNRGLPNNRKGKPVLSRSGDTRSIDEKQEVNTIGRFHLKGDSYLRTPGGSQTLT